MEKIGSIGRTSDGKYAIKVESGWQLFIPMPGMVSPLHNVEVIYEPNVLDGLGPGSVIYCEGDVYVRSDRDNWELAGMNALYTTHEIMSNFSEGEIEVLRRG